MRSAEASAIFESVANWMLRHPATSLGTMLPGLWLVREEPIESAELPARIVSAIARCDMTVWGELLEVTPSHLLDIRGFGEGSIQHFLAVAVRIAAMACCREQPPARAPTVDVFEDRRFPPRPDCQTLQLRRLVEWGVNEARATTFGELLAACSQDQIPDDIRLILNALLVTPLPDVFPESPPVQSLESLVDDLCGMVDLRRQSMFLARISLNNPRILEDIATEFEVTRERVRQLFARAEERIREGLATPRFAPIGWRAHTLRTKLGIAVPADSPVLNDTIEHVLKGVSVAGREQVLDFLMWLAGPYTWDSSRSWLRRGELLGPNVIHAFADQSGRVDMERLAQYLSQSGLLPSVHAKWLRHVGRLKNVDGNWLLWEGSVLDKAARLLEIWGRPATPEEIVNAIGEGHGVVATRQRITEDERFMRVDMARIGLRSWGMEEYSSIAEEIEQELEHRGGTADVGDLVATLVARFNLREPSVRSYLNAPMFVLEGDTVRRRTSADPHAPVPCVTETAGCYLLGPDVLAWRLDVNADTIRGSGRQLPAAIAAWLGVEPGARRSLAAKGGAVSVTWPETSMFGPALGSIRFLVERAEARAGDSVLLCFNRHEETVGLTRIDTTTANAASGLERLALITGIPNGDGKEAFLHNLGVALGVRGTPAAVRAAPRSRGESTLAALVPVESASPDLDAAIESLGGLL